MIVGLTLLAACAGGASPAPIPAPAIAPPLQETALNLELSTPADLPGAAEAWAKLPPDGVLTLTLRAPLTGGSLTLDDPFGTTGPHVILEGGGFAWKGGSVAIRGSALSVRDLVLDDTSLSLGVVGSARIERVALLSSRVPETGGSHSEQLALQVRGLAPGAGLTVTDSVIATLAPGAAFRLTSAIPLAFEGSVLAGGVEVRGAAGDPAPVVRSGAVIGTGKGLILDPGAVLRPWDGAVPWAAAARARDLAAVR